MKKKILFSALIVAIVFGSTFSIMGHFYSSLQSDYHELNENYDALTMEHQLLQANYTYAKQELNNLNQEHKALLDSYGGLEANFTSLQSSYVILSRDYNNLSNTFLCLSTDYANLTSRFHLLQKDYASLNHTFTLLQHDFNSLSKEYTHLTESYHALSENYSTLIDAHSSLQQQYFTLNSLHQQLQEDYDELNATYVLLLEEYDTLLKFWNEPPEYVVKPTWEEVENWLATDETDTITYNNETFLCGDFSIMLIQHAKEKHWRMLFTVIEFDHYDENPNGTERHHGNYGHAFVSVFTTEGMVYIEPQTDFMWYLYEEEDPEKKHVEFEDWVYVDFEEEWFGNIFVQYYNRMAGPTQAENNPTSLKVEVLSKT